MDNYFQFPMYPDLTNPENYSTGLEKSNEYSLETKAAAAQTALDQSKSSENEALYDEIEYLLSIKSAFTQAKDIFEAVVEVSQQDCRFLTKSTSYSKNLIKGSTVKQNAAMNTRSPIVASNITDVYGRNSEEDISSEKIYMAANFLTTSNAATKNNFKLENKTCEMKLAENETQKIKTLTKNSTDKLIHTSEENIEVRKSKNSSKSPYYQLTKQYIYQYILHDKSNCICILCSSKFKILNDLEYHLEINHKIGKYTCIHCHQGFAYLSTGRRHVERFHTHDDNCRYKCPDCSKTFKTRPNCYQNQKRCHKKSEF